MLQRRWLPLWTLAAAVLQLRGVSGIPRHARFNVDEEMGVIEALANPQLRLNAKGGDIKEGDPIVLWPCTAHNHELFDFYNGSIKLRANRGMCLNAQGGANFGAKIVTWPCSHAGFREAHEGFELGADGRIRMEGHPDKCINVKEGSLALGTEIVLWSCGDTDSHTHDVFEYKDGVLQLKSHPEFRLNVAGGELADSAPVVLWTCAPGSHEMFEFTHPQNRIRLKQRPEFCLNAESGLQPGSRIVIWPCHDEAEAHEKFVYDRERQVIHAQFINTLAFNVKEGNMNHGGEVILWTTDEEEL